MMKKDKIKENDVENESSVKPKKKKKKKKIILIIVIAIVAILVISAVIAIKFFNSSINNNPVYSVEALPESQQTELVTEQSKRLATFVESVPTSASERHKYDIKVAVSKFTCDYSYTMITLNETVSMKNTTGTELNEISMRDYAQQWIESARKMDTASKNDYNPFPLDTKFSNIKNFATGATLNAERDKNDPSIVFIKLDKPLANGEEITFSFDFVAPITQSGLRSSIATIGVDKYSMNLGNFYPVLSEWNDGNWINHPDYPAGECFLTTCSDYNVTVSAPEGWKVIATGKESQLFNDNGYTIWTCSATNVRDFAMTVTNGMDFKYAKTKTGVDVRVWYYSDGYSTALSFGNNDEYTGNLNKAELWQGKENLDMLGKLCLDSAVTALETFDEKFGKYPYETMDVVETDLGRCGAIKATGMEYPQYVTVSENLYDPSNINDINEWYDDLYTNIQTSGNLSDTIAHEIGHNWFYGVVGNDEFTDTWLDEGLTSYTELEFCDAANKNLNKDDFINSDSDEIFFKLTFSNKIDKSINLKMNEFTYSPLYYKKGAKFIYELRKTMGDDKFYSMIQEYYNTYSFKEATTEDFIEIMNKYIDGNKDAQKLAKKYLSRY